MKKKLLWENDVVQEESNTLQCAAIVVSLCKAIKIACSQKDWCLFSDRSLKAMPLNNENKYQSFPLAHSMYFKVDYNSVKTFLDALKYDEYF